VAEARRTQSLLAAITGAATVRAYRIGPRHLAGITDRSAAVRDVSLRVARVQGWFTCHLNAAELTGVAGLLIAGFALVRSDAITVGTATAAALYFLRLFDPIGMLLGFLDEAQSAGAGAGPAGRRRTARPTAEPAPTAAAGRRLGHAATAAARLRRRARGAARPRPAAGRRRAAGRGRAERRGQDDAGCTGRGIHRPSTGAVLLGGVDVAELDPDSLRRQVGLVTQEVHVFAGTLADDLRLAAPGAGDDDLVAALATVGALGWVQALPDGLATIVGEGGRSLTATQAQQVALARLVLADPAVAVLDEATAEAGGAGARVLEAAAGAALAGRTALVIAHRLTQAAAADRVLVLDKGHAVETGTHDQLVATGGVYAGLWAAWTGARGAVDSVGDQHRPQLSDRGPCPLLDETHERMSRRVPASPLPDCRCASLPDRWVVRRRLP
jgi:ATP-binding cassette subfamily C protein